MSENEEKSTDPLLALSDDLAILDGIAHRWRLCYLAQPEGNKIGVRELSALDRAIEALRNTRPANAHSDEAETAAIELLRHRLCNDEDGWRALLTLLDALAYRKEMHRAANARGDGETK